MSASLYQRELDALGLPPGLQVPDMSDAEMRKFMTGDCSGFGLPPPSSFPTPQEVQEEARKRSTNIIADWKQLSAILSRHEATIRKRWLKKTNTNRKFNILGAWPNMSAQHRPDFEAFRREGSKLQSQSTQHREAYMFPYMNLEDLVKGKTMLLLMNSRGRHPPNMFAQADADAMRLGHVSGAVMPAFLNLYTMRLEGQSVDTYGKLVSWDDDEEAMMKTFQGLAHLPGTGLQILEIQEKVLRFLVACCMSILHDIPGEEMIDNFPPIEEPPPIKDGSEYPSLAMVAAEAPYRLPADIDFHRLSLLLQAKRDSAVDNVRALREDPGYYLDVLKEWAFHRQENLLDTNNQAHPVLNTPLFWQRVIENVVLDAYGSLITWNVLVEQLDTIIKLQRKYSGIITPHEALPQDYMKALLTLRYSLGQARKGLVGLLKTGLPASPAYRSNFVREPHIPGSSMIKLRSRGETDVLLWHFTQLWTEQQCDLVGFPNVMDEIERLIESDSKKKAKISAWIAKVLGDFGVVSRIRHELDIYQPWAAGYDNAWVDHEDAVEKDFRRAFSAFGNIHDHLKDVSFPELGAPTNGRFAYPSDKRRNKQTTETMQHAEADLDKFWRHVDNSFQRSTGKNLGTIVRNIMDIPLPERTPDWVEPPKAVKNTSTPGLENVSIQKSFSNLRVGATEQPAKFNPIESKSKLKTRGIANELPSSVQEATLSAPEENDKQPVFALKPRALKVFRTLFFNPSNPDLPGEVPWTDFLFAMSATGFAPEKMYGSVWQFTPTTLDVERSIQFHEPHPVSKIPFRNARRIGRRLARAYGWHGGMFVSE